MVPTNFWDVSLEALTAELISNTTNIIRNKARVVINARLTNNDRFYLFYQGAPVRPFIFQQRGFNDGQNIHTGFLGDSSERGFMRRNHVFGADARYNMGYGLWQFGVRILFTV